MRRLRLIGLNDARMSGGRAMARRVPIFQFRLRNGRSIGPVELTNLWVAASGSEDVAVSRELRNVEGLRPDAVYLLSAPPDLFDLAGVETRLRRLLQDTLFNAHVELKRML